MTDSVDLDISICCLLLTMPQEVDVTIQALDSLLYSGDRNLTVLVLVNGGESEALRQCVQSLDHVQFFESPENLGVAGGRAFLAQQGPAKKADIIAIIDNDLLLPTDYLKPLCAQLMQDRKTGIVGASMLDYPHMKNWLDTNARVETGPLGRRLPRFGNADVREYLQNNLKKELFSHLGSHPDWMQTYFPRRTLMDEVNRRRDRNPDENVFLAKNPKALRQYGNGGSTLIEASNIAGCTQVFRRELYDELGGIREEYSPYGYEDVDFAISAQRAGYRNYTLTHAFSLHGTDDRHHQRKTISGLWPATRNVVKAYTLLAHNHCPWQRRPFLLTNSILIVIVDLITISWRLAYETGGLFLRISAAVFGFFNAQTAILGKRRNAQSIQDHERGERIQPRETE